MAGLRPTGIEYPVGSGTYIDIERDTSDYQALFLADQTFAVAATPNMESRRNSSALLTSISVDGRTIPMTIARKSAGTTTSATFHTDVKRWFDPGKGRSGTRYLRILGDDATTVLRLAVHVVYLAPRPGAIDMYDVQLQAVIPYFEALTETSTVVTTSGTVTNNGNARAQTTLEITGGTSISGNQYTITDTTGRGLVNYPFVIADVAPTTSQADSYVLVNGNSVAFRQGASSASYWVFVDLPPSGAVTVDILRNTGVTNPLAGTLDIGNLQAANTSNAQFAWDTWSVKTVPERNAIWHETDVRIGWLGTTAVYYGSTTNASAEAVFNISDITVYDNGSSALLLAVGANGGTLVGLVRVTAYMSDTRAYVYKRAYGSRQWTVAWSTLNNGTTTTSIDVSDAVEIVVGMELYRDVTASGNRSLTLSWYPPGPGTLSLTSYPTLSSATATTWRILNGVITNSGNGQTLTFTNFILRSGTLTIAATIDYNQRALSNSVSGPMLGSVTFGDQVDLFSVDPGSNTVTETIDGSVTVKHRGTYL